jgi:hypothetical protein
VPFGSAESLDLENGSGKCARDLQGVLLTGPDGELQVILASTARRQHAEEVVRHYRL